MRGGVTSQRELASVLGPGCGPPEVVGFRVQLVALGRAVEVVWGFGYPAGAVLRVAVGCPGPGRRRRLGPGFGAVPGVVGVPAGGVYSGFGSWRLRRRERLGFGELPGEAVDLGVQVGSVERGLGSLCGCVAAQVLAEFAPDPRRPRCGDLVAVIRPLAGLPVELDTAAFMVETSRPALAEAMGGPCHFTSYPITPSRDRAQR